MTTADDTYRYRRAPAVDDQYDARDRDGDAKQR